MKIIIFVGILGCSYLQASIDPSPDHAQEGIFHKVSNWVQHYLFSKPLPAAKEALKIAELPTPPHQAQPEGHSVFNLDDVNKLWFPTGSDEEAHKETLKNQAAEKVKEEMREKIKVQNKLGDAYSGAQSYTDNYNKTQPTQPLIDDETEISQEAEEKILSTRTTEPSKKEIEESLSLMQVD